jgi:rhamnosyltransferase
MKRETTPSITAVPEATARTVCAVVVAFFPDNDFEARLRVLLPQVDELVIVDNTPGGTCKLLLMALTLNETRIHIIENQANAGIAAALNQGIERTLQRGRKWILTLDQDTKCYPDMIDTLIDVYKACEPKPVIVGSNYFDSHNNRPVVHACGDSKYQDCKTVITSGSLIDAEMARDIGGFREDYFIDQVDHEFCLRARSYGYRVIISCKPAMTHSVGNPGGVLLPILGVLPNHSAIRKYYIARNTVVTVSKYWRQEPEWCLRRLVRLVLGLGLMAILEKQKIAKVRAFIAGITDGMMRRMGPCNRQWLSTYCASTPVQARE